MANNFGGIVRRGDSGKDARLAQEWLTFHGFATAIDGIFGSASELAAKNFQTKAGIASSGVVDTATQAALLSPIQKVQQPIAAGGRPLGDLFIQYAQQHLAQHPIEIGGENCGPWVRLYMNGNEGTQWPWCAGFATWVLRQACTTLNLAMPHPYAFGCDFLAAKAQSAGRFISVKTPADYVRIKPGYLFLVRRTDNDWSHVGIVESIQGDVISTIEGNTNDQGSREGFEVCHRTRSLSGKDYLVV